MLVYQHMKWLIKKLKKFYYTRIRHMRIPTVHVSGRLNPHNKKFLSQYGDRYIKTLSEIVTTMHQSRQAGKQIIVEIGFGDGEHIVPVSLQHPESFVVGVELYFLGIVLAAKKLFRNTITNTLLTRSDARDFLDAAGQGIINTCYILFPDPWRKAKHNKRRLLKYPFMHQVMQSVTVDGQCYIATDWAEYADEIDQVVKQLETEGVVESVRYDIPVDNFQHTVPQVQEILKTSFAKRAAREGRDVAVFVLTKK